MINNTDDNSPTSPSPSESPDSYLGRERSYFELYNIPVSFHPDQALVKAKYYELSRLYHPDRFAAGDPAAMAQPLRMAATNNEAYKTLKNADATMAYVLKTHNLLEEEEKYTLPPAFLMEMMDLNEVVSDFEDGPDNESTRLMAIDSLAEQLQAWEAATAALTKRFDNGEQNEALLLQIKDMYFRRKYLLRIQERIDRFSGI